MVQGSSFEDKVLQLSYFLHIGKISSPISFTLLRSSYEYVSFSRLIFVIYRWIDFYLIFENFVDRSWRWSFWRFKEGEKLWKIYGFVIFVSIVYKTDVVPTFRAILTRQLNYSTYFNLFSSNFTHFSYDINNMILIK